MIRPGLYPYHPLVYYTFIDIPECCCQQELTIKCKVCQENYENIKEGKKKIYQEDDCCCRIF